MAGSREISPAVALAVIVAVLVLVGFFFWWQTRPQHGDIAVSEEEWQRRYQQMLRSSQPYNPPPAPQAR